MIHPFNLEWYSPYLDLEHTIQVCMGHRVKYTKFEADTCLLFRLYKTEEIEKK